MTVNAQKPSASQKLRIFCHKCQQKLDVTKLKSFDKIPCPACAAQLIIPKWFDSYLLEEECGVGGVAVVYRALDLTLDREIAIKISSKDDSSSRFSEIFLHEGRIAASLNYPGIVPIYSCGKFEGRCFLVMQYMPGGSLEQKIKQNSELEIIQVLDWMFDITSALQAALGDGVIHHDIKPANILLDSGANARIGDFGLAYALHDLRSQSLLSELSSFGSPDYVSPEKLIHGFEDNKGDIFSLGVSFYELLTGKKPFKQAHEDEDILEVRASVCVAAPHDIRPEISVSLSKFIIRLLKKDPVRRPDYEEIIEELKIFREKYRKLEDKTLYRFMSKYL